MLRPTYVYDTVSLNFS